jgi:hypothetical protein
MERVRRASGVRWAFLVGLLVAVAAIPSAAGFEREGREVPQGLLGHVSQVVAARYYAHHPQQAPAAVARGLAQVHEGDDDDAGDGDGHGGSGFCESGSSNDVFNCDDIGFPQNEESVGVCPTNTKYVLQGTNDYRGVLEPPFNTTGWHWSTDRGHSVDNEGFLPSVAVDPTAFPNHDDLPSGGDPVDFIPAGCDSVYAASLAYNADNPFGDANGIAVYKTTPAILSSCGGGNDPSCWPVRRLVAQTDEAFFNDKEWMFVGNQNGTRYVWVTYSEFVQDETAPIGYSAVKIRAVRCDANLATCTPPMDISTVDQDVQFSDVTVGPDGRAYITWARIDGELPGTPEGDPGQPQTFTIKIRVETAPGSGVFGPEHVVAVEDQPIPFGGFLQANDFRVATYPKSDVAMVRGQPRIFVIWDACRFRLFDTTCEKPAIKLAYSLDPNGAAWSEPTFISHGGVNYFPTISADRSLKTNRLVASWFTNQYDPAFENEQDVVLTAIRPGSGRARGLKRLTSPSNESEADPLLGGFFIGDYIEAVLVKEKAWVGYNANYRKVQVLGVSGAPFDEGFRINQQDNYLAITVTD